jgi:serine/threonine-protein kinase
VYRARDTRLGRTVALRVLSPAVVADPAKFDALGALALRLTKLSHPNIAMLFEGGQEGSRYYLAFEFVQGEPLASLINGRPLQVRRALEFAINLADALAEAHSADLIHGDIRPDTIMITPKDRAKFMNFGLAPFTRGGVSRVNASSAYVSPEELAGQPADARSDIYSLGAVMFEMLTGRQRARGLVLSGLHPTVPAEIEQIMSRMLAATVEHRAQSAATVAAELRSVAAIIDMRTEAAEAAAAVEPLRRSPRRRRGLVIFVMLLVLAGLAAAAWYVSRPV